MDRRVVAIAMVAVLVAVAAGPMVQDDADAEPVPAAMPLAIGVVGGFAIGLAVGLVIGTMIDDPSSPSADQEEVYKQCRDLYAGMMVSNWDTAKNMISSVLPADTDLWAYTASYWNRATELTVADWWSLGSSYDADLMTEESMLRQNVMSYIYDWQAAVDTAYNNILQKNLKLTGDCYGDMVLSVSWDGGSIVPGPGNPVSMDLLEYVVTGDSSSTIYLDTSTDDSGGNYNAGTSGMLYAFGKDAKLVYIGDGVGKGTRYEVGSGQPVDVTAWPTGLYRIETSGVTLAGPISEAAGPDAADVGGAMVFTAGSGSSADMALITPSGDDVSVYHHGSTVTSSKLEIRLDYTGRDGSSSSSVLCDGSKYNIVRDWDGLVDQIGTIIDKAAVAGETIWGIFDAAEASSSFLSPSSITTTVEGVTLTAVQSQAIYVQAMMQIADYWNLYGEDIESAEFTTNRESLDLYVYGDIYYNGQLWAENVVFTPYMSIGSQTIRVGQQTVWDGPGFAMLWAQVDDYGDWDGSTSSSSYELIDLSKGYVLEAERIVKGGEDVSEITLTQTVIDRYNSGGDSPDDPTDPVRVLDGGTLILIIMLLLALCVFLICYALDIPAAGLVIALALVVVGLVFSDTIASVILGTAKLPWS